MLFPISERGYALRERVRAFMRERVLPNERVFAEQIAAGPNPGRTRRFWRS